MSMTLRPILLLTALLAAGCGGDGDSRFCFGSAGFCDDAFGRNDPPHADAGADLEAVAGDRVELDGSASEDRDGRIELYSWSQRAGPPVALEDGDEAVVRFEAPEVTTEETLRFRLVVTDDDGASDHDEVTVTVVPFDVAALAAGVELLKHVHDPLAGDPGRRSADAIGLWLAARVAAADAGAEPAPDVLLDELRTLEQTLLAVPAPVARTPLFRLGHARVAAFTARRDPATAELAARHGGPPRTVPLEEWGEALRAAHPALGWFTDDPSGRRHAAALLLAFADRAFARDAAPEAPPSAAARVMADAGSESAPEAAAASAAAVLLLASPPDASLRER